MELNKEDEQKARAKIGLLVNYNYWTYKEIALYFGIGHTRACEMKKEVAKQYGHAQFAVKGVSARAVLKYCGLDYDEELRNLKDAISDHQVL